MSEAINRLKIGAEDLRKGMYVVEPDRPWVEIPLPFAGFTIQSDEELKVLREYCDHVYVDPERSADSLNERELGASRSAGGTETTAGRADPGSLEGDEAIDQSRRYPDAQRLRSQLEDASRTVGTAQRFLNDTFDAAYRGNDIDFPGAQSATAEMIATLTRVPTASLLLTSLNQRDNFTTMHSVHVCMLMLAFCLRAGMDRRKTEILGLGALLHDIGKAQLPADLVNRPGTLSEEEWELVKRHPVDGYQLLADSGAFPRPVLKVARMHHERKDGTGYPDGLTKESLPDYVLVTALINRYQALTSPRPYREAEAPDKVLRSLYSQAGDMYGSRPVEAFIRCVGIYPVGSVVELDNGALAVVAGSRPNARLRPTVVLVRTPDGEPYENVVLLNLAAEAEKWEARACRNPVRSVRRVRNPAEVGIDPGAVIVQSFGIHI